MGLRKNVNNSGTVKATIQCQTYLESTEQMWSVDVRTTIVGPVVLSQCALKVWRFSAEMFLTLEP